MQLKPHPEGGYYKEIYSAKESISSQELTVDFKGERSLATSIYFLLEENDVSHFHSIKSDEIWYYHYGASLTIYEIETSGNLKKTILGTDIEKGEVLQAIIPAGSIFGAALDSQGSYSLVACMVSPGFDFQDFKLHSIKDLLQKHPQQQEVIMKLGVAD